MFWRATLPLFFVGIAVMLMLIFMRENISFITDAITSEDPCPSFEGWKPLLSKEQLWFEYQAESLATQHKERLDGEFYFEVNQRLGSNCERQIELVIGLPEKDGKGTRDIAQVLGKAKFAASEPFLPRLLSFLSSNPTLTAVTPVLGGKVGVTQDNPSEIRYLFSSKSK